MDLIGSSDAAWALVPLLFLVLWVALVALTFALVVWILYTVIWRAVRRGMREFYGVQPERESPAQYSRYATWTPPEETEALEPDVSRAERRHRSGRLTR